MFGAQRLITATQKCGILAFNIYILSDHRVLWIDINIHDILRQQLPSLYQHPIAMNSKNTPWAKNSRLRTSAVLNTHNLQSDLQQLSDDVNNNPNRAEKII